MEESKLASKCYFCENKFSHKMVIFGFDPAQTQICHAKNDNTNVQAPGVTMIKDGIVPTEAEKTTDDNTTVISTTTSGQLIHNRPNSEMFPKLSVVVLKHTISKRNSLLP